MYKRNNNNNLTVRVGAGVGHTEYAWSGMFQPDMDGQEVIKRQTSSEYSTSAIQFVRRAAFHRAQNSLLAVES